MVFEFLSDLAGERKTDEPESDLFLLFSLGVLFGAKSTADLLIQMKVLDNQDFVNLMNTAVELDARFYALGQEDRDEVIRQICAGMDCVTVIETVDFAPLSAKAIRRIKAFEDLCDARLADHVPLPHETPPDSASQTRH